MAGRRRPGRRGGADGAGTRGCSHAARRGRPRPAHRADRRQRVRRGILVLAGAGNNGGDALYAGARLARRGADVRALLLNPGRAHPGGLRALTDAGGSTVDEPPSTVDIVLDGIVGIGGKGALRPRAAEIMEKTRGTVIAVDVPSGVDADT